MTEIDPLQFSTEQTPELLTRTDTVNGPYYSESTDVTAPHLPRGVVIGIGIKPRGEETYGSHDYEGFRERVDRIYDHVCWFDGGEQ